MYYPYKIAEIKAGWEVTFGLSRKFAKEVILRCVHKLKGVWLRKHRLDTARVDSGSYSWL